MEMKVLNKSGKDPERTVYNSEDKFDYFLVRLRLNFGKNNFGCPSLICKGSGRYTKWTDNQWCYTKAVHLQQQGKPPSAICALPQGLEKNTGIYVYSYMIFFLFCGER